MAARSIVCEDCGHEYETSRANTKYCSVCRLARDLKFVGNWRQECEWCGKEFAPLSKSDTECGECRYAPRKPGIVACLKCGDEAPRVRKEIDVCTACAYSRPNRKWFRQAVLNKQQRRIEGVE